MSRTFCHILGATLLFVALVTSASAQTGGESPAGDSAATSESVATVGVFPAPPQSFRRGTVPANPAVGGRSYVGFYYSYFKLFIVIAAFLGWAKLVRWVNWDSGALSVRRQFWNTIVVPCGLVAFLLAFCMPAFFLSFLIIAIGQAVPVGLYVAERNAKVPESGKVLTPAHLKLVGIRMLARLGINVNLPKGQKSVLGPDIEFYGKSDKAGENVVVNRQVENSRGYMAAKELIFHALSRKTTDIHLEPKENEFSIRMRIDGVMYPGESYDRSVGDAVINIIKVLGAMDITEKRKPQDGSFRAETEGREIDFRVATQGTRQGEKMSLRILDQSSVKATLPGLGFRKQLQEGIREIVSQPHGLMLVCGPTGAGKSTTLYACLSEIDAYQRNIITVEDPVEYKMENVTQIEINTKAGQSFGGSLRSILRQDPDVVMIGEIRDGETAEIACQAANTGHMVFSTVHANDTITALYRIFDLGVEPFVLSSSVSAILAQRLARRLCPNCKEAYKPKAALLKELGLPADKIEAFYRPLKNPDPEDLCETCEGLGFKGRTGVFELLTVTDRMRDLIREKAQMSAIKAEARKNGMLYMKEEGLRLVARGLTSLDELLRVVK